MAKRKKLKGKVLSQKEIAPDIFDMWIETGLAEDAKAGQFVGIYPHNASTLLPRPISICEKEAGKIRLVYRVVGKGTGEFAGYQQGEEVSLLGVLGNGFPVEEAAGKCVILMSGGIGIPPMVQTAKEITRKCADSSLHIFVGYRDGNLFLKEELEQYGAVHVATEDGSAGVRGNVLDAAADSGVEPGLIMACGPMPMLRAVKNYAAGRDVKAYISLEERMACGVGACLGCVCKTKETDPHSHVHNARICTDGPVFDAKEVDI